jgi:integral membrane protein
MPSAIRPADIPRIRTVLTVYRVSAIVTGAFLLGVVVMMVTRYGLGADIEWSSAYGFDLAPKELIDGRGTVNVSTILLQVHGLLYVVYLAVDLVLWRLGVYGFGRFVWIAMGGIVPLLSFVFEFQVPPLVKRAIAAAEPVEAAP